jgi:hypothetical protein
MRSAGPHGLRLALLLWLGLLATGCAGRELAETALEIDLEGGDLLIGWIDLEVRDGSSSLGPEKVQLGGRRAAGTVVAVLPEAVSGPIELLATAYDTGGKEIASGQAHPTIVPFTLNRTRVDLIPRDGGPGDTGPDRDGDGSDGDGDAPHGGGDGPDGDGGGPVDMGPDQGPEVGPDVSDGTDGPDQLPDLATDGGDEGGDLRDGSPDAPDQIIGPCPGTTQMLSIAGSPHCCLAGRVIGGTCHGHLCSLDRASTSGYPVCYEYNSPGCLADGYRNFYGGGFGGFCCDGDLINNGDGCTGRICALDVRRAQGQPYCPSYAATLCPAGAPLYGDQGAGGYCCKGGTATPDICTGGVICAVDPILTAGFPLCFQEGNYDCVLRGYQNLFRGEAGGFCCDGPLGPDRDSCTGNTCALDPARTAGYPVCPATPPSSPCVPGALAFDLQDGGFCCGPGGALPGGECIGSTICALDPARTRGYPVCYQSNSPTCVDQGYLNFYGGEVGGFCCTAAISADHAVCTGDDCALDVLQSQGVPFCASAIATACPAAWTFFGESGGGFCCGPGGTLVNGACMGGQVCAVNPALTQGHPICPPT